MSQAKDENKETPASWKAIVLDTAAEFSLMALSIMFGYNTYKEWMRSVVTTPISPAAKDAIKAAFPYALLLVGALALLRQLVLHNSRFGKRNLLFQAATFLILLAGLNLAVFLSVPDRHVFISMNLAFLYSLITLGPYGLWGEKLFRRLSHLLDAGAAGGLRECTLVSATRRFFAESALAPYLVAGIALGLVYLYLIQAAIYSK